MTSTSFSPGAIAGALSALEAKERGLLTWGITEGALTDSEVRDALLDFEERWDSYLEVGSLRNVLMDRKLLLAVPGTGLFRTRMAETLRVLATLRQTFRNEAWWQGRPLVMDYRFVTQPRTRPRFDRPKGELDQLVSDPLRLAVLNVLAPAQMAGFQVRGVSRVLDLADSGRAGGVVVTAGTGSGKTNAFYLPALAWIAGSIYKDPRHWLRALTLYPRKELLRDQLLNALRLVRKLADSDVPGRPVSIGAWYEATPGASHYLEQGWTKAWRVKGNANNPSAWVCPYLACPDCESELLWSRTDVRANRERLVCDGCGFIVDGEQLRLTRASMQQRPPDLLFTTTESLNRQLADRRSWAAFGIRTKPPPRFVLLDEIHTYEGITGAQNAYLLRRYRHAVFGSLAFVGLSATLRNAEGFTAQLAGLTPDRVVGVSPDTDEMRDVGAEYVVALRHDPTQRTSPLSVTIQSTVALSRSLDRRLSPVSNGVMGHRLFVFGDRHDTINRLLWDTLDAEGWRGERGAIRRGRPPLTLAHLRSESQSRRPEAQRESSGDRYASGQWWWHAEAVGHLLDEDEQKRVARTTSKDPGVSADADVIVATSTLEVGYDDSGVGAIIQHKSPHDAARYVQRKGRAGRDAWMRPWTVIVLSDYGRDRLTWQLLEGLTDPTLKPQYLPVGNRYVQRIQAVYSFLDWLSAELGRMPGAEPWSVWADLSRPAEDGGKGDEQRRRQHLAADLIEDVLRGGPALGRFEEHLRRALGLTVSEIQAVMWSPPRAIMLAVLPTAWRRLRSQWSGEEPVGEFGGSPLPEFMTTSQFGDLLTPEVSVSIPPDRQGDPEFETTSVLHVLTEYMPGNVSRRHSISDPDQRHWVPPPSGWVGSIDIRQAYNAEFVRHVSTFDAAQTEYALYRPRAFALEFPDRSVSESTRVRPIWRTALEPIGKGSRLDLPGGHWSDLIVGIRSHLHAGNDGVHVVRMAIGGEGRTLRREGWQTIEVSFSATPDDDEAFEVPPAVALGVDFDADAMALEVKLPEELPQPTPVERTDRFEDLFHAHPDFQSVSVFTRMTLLDAVLVVLVKGDATTAPFTDLSDQEMRQRLVEALEALGQSGVADQDAVEAGDTDAPSEVEAFISSDAAVASIRSVAAVLTQDRDPEWDAWTRRRLAATVAALFIEAAIRLCPGVDADELMVDIGATPTQSSTIDVWISEMTPGGNGYLEQIHEAIATEPAKLLRLLDRMLEPSDVEVLDSQLRALLADVSSRGPEASAAGHLRNAWSAGSEAASAAHAELRSRLLNRRPATSRLAMTTLVNRILGPGSHSELPEVAERLVLRWDQIESEHGFAIDSRVFAAAFAREDSSLDVPLQLGPEPDPRRRVRTVANLLWPRGRTAAKVGLSLWNRFGQALGVDRDMLGTLIESEAEELPIDTLDDDIVAEVKRRLSSGQLVVSTSPESAELLHRLNLVLQAEPVDLGVLYAYPTVIGVTRDRDRTSMRLLLPEALR